MTEKSLDGWRKIITEAFTTEQMCHAIQADMDSGMHIAPWIGEQIIEALRRAERVVESESENKMTDTTDDARDAKRYRYIRTHIHHLQMDSFHGFLRIDAMNRPEAFGAACDASVDAAMAEDTATTAPSPTPAAS